MEHSALSARSKPHSRTLVFTATYNEADNVRELVENVFSILPDVDFLFVDDHSPDGTGELLENLKKEYPRLIVVHRTGKLGLGTAHMYAMNYAVELGYDTLITMDADFSHHPKYLPTMLSKLSEGHEFVIGSRYTEGGSCDYGFSRQFISRTANTLARFCLGIPLKETTTSYRGFNVNTLRKLNVSSIQSEGYSFFFESVFYLSRLSKSLSEFPIHFEDRRMGTSKISKKEIFKALLSLVRLTLKRLGGKKSVLNQVTVNGAEPPARSTKCHFCGPTMVVQSQPARRTREIQNEFYNCTSSGHRAHGPIVRCLSCNLIFILPEYSKTDIESAYSSVEDESYLTNLESRRKTFEYNLNRIQSHLPKGGSLLEVGAYLGVFLDVARKRNFNVCGVEPSRWAAKKASETFDLRVDAGTLDEFRGDQKFDVIAAWDVMEHLVEPLTELHEMNARLKPGGILTFSTLDVENWYPKLMGRRWPWYMDMHLYYFTQTTMENLLKRAGFETIHSERYCHIITLDYFFTKLDILGIWGAKWVQKLVPRLVKEHVYLPFRFGDIRMYVCRKVVDVKPAIPAKTRPKDRGKEHAKDSGAFQATPAGV